MHYYTDEGLETAGLFLLVIVGTDPMLGLLNVYECRRLPPELLSVGAVSVLGFVISLISEDNGVCEPPAVGGVIADLKGSRFVSEL